MTCSRLSRGASSGRCSFLRLPLEAGAFPNPLQVAVKGLLPDEHSGVLETLSEPEGPRFLSYRSWLVVLGVLWALPVVWLVLRRLGRRRPKVL